jgi:hypothetical protein
LALESTTESAIPEVANHLVPLASRPLQNLANAPFEVPRIFRSVKATSRPNFLALNVLEVLI